ncbi:hypothetical protein ACJX0J_039658, partial [Zea mays]
DQKPIWILVTYSILHEYLIEKLSADSMHQIMYILFASTASTTTCNISFFTWTLSHKFLYLDAFLYHFTTTGAEKKRSNLLDFNLNLWHDIVACGLLDGHKLFFPHKFMYLAQLIIGACIVFFKDATYLHDIQICDFFCTKTLPIFCISQDFIFLKYLLHFIHD